MWVVEWAFCNTSASFPLRSFWVRAHSAFWWYRKNATLVAIQSEQSINVLISAGAQGVLRSSSWREKRHGKYLPKTHPWVTFPRMQGISTDRFHSWRERHCFF